MSSLPKNINLGFSWPQVILFGDSLTQYSFDPDVGCWGALLADKLRRRCDVVNRGFSGYTSQTALLALPKLFNAEYFNSAQIAVFVIMLGTNDIQLMEENSSEIRISHQLYRENLKNMIKYLTSNGLDINKIVLLTPPPIDTAVVNKSQINAVNRYYYCERIENHVEECISVGNELDIEVLNIHKAYVNNKNWKACFVDGIHFNKSGAKIIFNKLWPCIERRVKELPFLLPHYSQLDVLDVEKVFRNKDNNDNYQI